MSMVAGRWLDPDGGKEVAHRDMMARMSHMQAVLLGETHDRYDIHRWQLHVTTGLFALRDRMAVAFEMFPRAVQPALDRWVAGEIDLDAFLDQSRWAEVWRFDPALYTPIFHFCRQFRVPMLAVNCRRALVTEVGKSGWDAIPVDERDGVTPAVPATPEHRQYLFDLTGGRRPDRAAQSAQAPEFDRFVRAQQTWDRAFACGIADSLKADPERLVVGIIGRGHLEFGHGTPHQLRDLGVRDVGILLPHDVGQGAPDAEIAAGIADGVFALDDASR
ncbi:ChaN family lipoprotein (plasmid) [Aliirhizobium terrae]|uniref:ChaN family lipoprotein n=1 Tax=Terrirhizobium terrae TaxID=2926709 RepID=UPI0025766E4B|nr:ChaN family lipoprotein [Rhizobium sp. CC-CFT758]WJH37807.1 ChaN family lipoprotein [Rhizobium sp. CC-CFT758]